MTTMIRTERGKIVLDVTAGVLGACFTALPALVWPGTGAPVGPLPAATATALVTIGAAVILGAVVVRVLRRRLPPVATTVAAAALVPVVAGLFAGLLARPAGLTAVFAAAVSFTVWFAVRMARATAPSPGGTVGSGGS